MKDYGIVIQARMGSSRCPGKISYPLQGEAMLAYQVKRLQAFGLKNIVIATTDQPADDTTVNIATALKIPYFRGEENDVLKRYIDCAHFFNFKNVVRIGGDDPLVDPLGILYLLEIYQQEQVDLLYTSHPSGWIYGTAAEVVSTNVLEKMAEKTTSPEDREHVLTYLKKDKSGFVKKELLPRDSSLNRKDIYVSIDYQEDLDLLEQITKYFTALGKRYSFTQLELIDLFDSGKLVITNKHLHSGF